jgi:hypothetical protein
MNFVRNICFFIKLFFLNLKKTICQDEICISNDLYIFKNIRIISNFIITDRAVVSDNFSENYVIGRLSPKIIKFSE